MDIYQYSLGINGIEKRVYKDVYTNSTHDKFIINEMDDFGGCVLYEIMWVDEDRLTTHYGFGDNLYLNYSEEKTNNYIKDVMYEEFRRIIIETERIKKCEIEMLQNYQNILKEGVEK